MEEIEDTLSRTVKFERSPEEGQSMVDLNASTNYYVYYLKKEQGIHYIQLRTLKGQLTK